MPPTRKELPIVDQTKITEEGQFAHESPDTGGLNISLLLEQAATFRVEMNKEARKRQLLKEPYTAK